MLRDGRGTLLLVGNLAVLRISTSSRFKRDVKTCDKRHWDMKPFKATIAALAKSNEKTIPRTYRDHALSGASLAGGASMCPPWEILPRTSGSSCMRSMAMSSTSTAQVRMMRCTGDSTICFDIILFVRSFYREAPSKDQK